VRITSWSATGLPGRYGRDRPVGFIEGAPGLDDATRRAILGGNAARLLGIEVPAGVRLISIQTERETKCPSDSLFRSTPPRARATSLLKCSNSAARNSRKDAGCLQFEIFRSVSNPTNSALLELWESQAALDAHAKLNQSRAPLRRGCAPAGGEREDYE